MNDLRISTSVREGPSSLSSLFYDNRIFSSVSDISNLSNHTISEPSSNEEVSHSNAINRLRSESENFIDNSVKSSDKSESIYSDSSEKSNDTKSARTPTTSIEVQRYSSSYWEKDSHFFVLSQSGKPIFSRYGTDSQIAAFIGVMQAMVSFVSSEGDMLKSMRAGKHTFVFVTKPNMILVGVSQSSFTVQQIKVILNYLYNQILSVLTFKSISRVYEKQPGIDIRRLLIGTDRYLNGMIDFMETDLGPQINAISCVPMHATLRQALLNTISQAIKVNDLVFAILLLDEKLVGVVRRKDQQPHPCDLHLILNLMRNSSTFKIQTCWLPICLPKFDADGFFYAHVSYLTERLSLLFLTVNPNQFDILQDCKENIIQAFESNDLFTKLNGKLFSIDELLKCNKLSNGEIQHFVYKLRTASQCIDYISPKLNLSINNIRYCYNTYFRLHSFIHLSDRPARLIYKTTSEFTTIVWQTANFELYATLCAMSSKRKIMETINKLLDVINKQKNRLFVLISPTF